MTAVNCVSVDDQRCLRACLGCWKHVNRLLSVDVHNSNCLENIVVGQRDVAANTIHTAIMFSSNLLEYASVDPAYSTPNCRLKSHGNKTSIWWYGDTQASCTVLSPSGMHRCLQISVNKGSVRTQGYLPRKEKGNPCRTAYQTQKN